MNPERLRELNLDHFPTSPIACPTCGVGPGEQCVSRTGRPCCQLHAGRRVSAEQPLPVGEVFASWMAAADGCACGNLQPPKVVIPSTLPGMAFNARYVCADCGQKWTRAYPPTRKEVAA